MISQETLFIICLAGCVLTLMYIIWLLLPADRAQAIRDRLAGSGGSVSVTMPGASGDPTGLKQFVKNFSRTLGKKIEPAAGTEQASLRDRLGRAGYYSLSAASLYLGARLLFLAAGLVGGLIIGMLFISNPKALPLAPALGGLFGYCLPIVWLEMRSRDQQRRLEHALPDALDLLVVCVESGLTVDAGFHRVGREIALAHPELARELSIAHMEMQMGVSRTDSLRNIAKRTGSTALQSLGAMLIQADRFGTSIAQSLRVYAESLRVKRRNIAEELAAKASVKIAVPLVFCIFPALMIVAGGPAMIRVYEHFVFRSTGS